MKIPKSLGCFTVFAVSILGYQAPVFGGESYIQADSYTSALTGQTGSNFGSSNLMYVGPPSSSTAIRECFLRFDLASALPPSIPGSAVEKATLKLYVTPGTNTAAASIAVDVLGSANFVETTINNTNKPAIDSFYTTVEVAVPAENVILPIDVTTMVQAWVQTSQPTIGFRISKVNPTSQYFIEFATKEHAFPNYRPQLGVQAYSRSDHDAV